MFTGLVEDVGRLAARASLAQGARLRISTKLEPLVLGESIAVMGVCLTVDSIVNEGFEADASSETLARTTLGSLTVGHHVHLERAVQAGGRLGGHIVAGHVDGLTRLMDRKAAGQSVELTFSMEGALAAYVASKGSIAIDGVSLTVNEVGGAWFRVMIVPHTRQATLLSAMRVGTMSNIEVDVLARYVVRWLQLGAPTAADQNPDQALMARLASSGFL